jgi:serine/threonine-protein kinase
MYEALLGFPPFDGADVYSISYKHVHETAVSPEVVDSRIPGGLASIVMRCLAKSPAERFARGHELADALLDWLPVGESAAAVRAARIARRPTPAGAF